MKIAIASEGDGKDAEISSRGGRAPYYIIIENGKIIDIIKNPFAQGGGGAGWSVAYMLAEKGVQKVYAGRFGPNMETALKEKGIAYEEKMGKITDLLQ